VLVAAQNLAEPRHVSRPEVADSHIGGKLSNFEKMVGSLWPDPADVAEEVTHSDGSERNLVESRFAVQALDDIGKCWERLARVAVEVRAQACNVQAPIVEEPR